MRRVEGVTPRVSFADLQRMPDDGNRYELYDGELHVVPSPVPIHQRIVARLFEVFLEFAKHAGGEVFCAPFDVVLSDFDVVQPDLIYFGAVASKRIKPREHVRFRPDLAVEVLSPSTARIDRGRKRELLREYGLPEYWVVDPDSRTLETWSLERSTDREVRTVRGGSYESMTQAGLVIDLQRLFRDVE
jgi:Uma2 family endonuclease